VVELASREQRSQRKADGEARWTQTTQKGEVKNRLRDLQTTLSVSNY
jgi:hypothetical protein